MSFSNRIATSNIIIDALTVYFWDRIKKHYKIKHEPYGYETHISQEAQKLLIRDYSNTSKHIRYTPDYILIGNYNSILNTLLLEYKVTKTPKFILREKQWGIGQIEADAWESYINLSQIGIRTAIIVYCPYHPRPLLCDYPVSNWETSDRQIARSSRGSGTDYINIDLNQLRSFDEFMFDEFSIDKNITMQLLPSSFYHMLRQHPNLSIEHHPKSYYQNNKVGFNWMSRYLET